MKSIPSAVQQVVENESFLHFGIANGVLNLTKTAKFIHALVEARAKKNVSVSAVTMALSRLKIQKRNMNARLRNVKVTSLNVIKNLAEITYEKTTEHIHILEEAEKEIRKSGGFCTLTVGTSEITLLATEDALSHIKKQMPFPKAEIPHLVAVAAQFDETYIPHAGMIYALVQQLTFQNINIIELSSTYTELVFYLEKKDLKIAFDTLYDQFM